MLWKEPHSQLIQSHTRFATVALSTDCLCCHNLTLCNIIVRIQFLCTFSLRLGWVDSVSRHTHSRMYVTYCTLWYDDSCGVCAVSSRLGPRSLARLLAAAPEVAGAVPLALAVLPPRAATVLDVAEVTVAVNVQNAQVLATLDRVLDVAVVLETDVHLNV